MTALHSLAAPACCLGLLLAARTLAADSTPKDGSMTKGNNWTMEGDKVTYLKEHTVNKEDFMVTLQNGNRFFFIDGLLALNGTEEEFPPQQVFEALQKIGWGNVEKTKALGIKRPFDFYANYRAQSVAWFAQNYPTYTAPAPLPVSPGKLRNLAQAPAQPRFPLTGKVWPGQYGEAAVCLWEDDKLAAFDFNQDDNNAPDQPGFREIAAKYGVKATFNLVTFDIGGGYNHGAWKAPGTWEDWRKAKEEGFHIASHSHMHLQDWMLCDGWPGFDFEAAESRRLLDENIPGQKTKVFVYPGGGTPEMQYLYRYMQPAQHHFNMLREPATKYYAAARGGSVAVPINPANQTDYFHIATTQLPKADFNYDVLLDPAPGNKYYRGWLDLFIHGLLLERWESDPQHIGYRKAFEWVAAHRDDLWIGFLDDIALYGQERDTATLTTTAAGEAKITLHLTSQMEPAIFDYPLTLKVRLADAWEGVKAQQAGQPIPAQIITHENAKYALLKARPDGGEITLEQAAGQ